MTTASGYPTEIARPIESSPELTNLSRPARRAKHGRQWIPKKVPKLTSSGSFEEHPTELTRLETRRF